MWIRLRSGTWALATPTCPRCHGTNLTRLISRVAIAKSDESRFDSMDDAAIDDLAD